MRLVADLQYPAGGRDWLACLKCHKAIQHERREELLDRVLMQPVPRTVPDRYAAVPSGGTGAS